MSKFVSKEELLTVDLGDGDWVKIPSRVSFKIASQFEGEEGQNNTDKTRGLLLALIKEWNLQENGEVAPIDGDHIDSLEIMVIKQITEAILPVVQGTRVEKKNSSTSEQQ